MPKSKQQKQEAIVSLVNNLKQAKGVVFANFQGLTVAQTEDLRGQCFKENVDMFVAKKTLVKRAFDEAGLTITDPQNFEGGVATFTCNADEIVPAKIVSTFAKKHEVVSVFGGILEGKFIDAVIVKKLAALPGKQELLGKMVGSLNAPISGFVRVLAGNLRGLVQVLNAYKESKV